MRNVYVYTEIGPITPAFLSLNMTDSGYVLSVRTQGQSSPSEVSLPIAVLCGLSSAIEKELTASGSHPLDLSVSKGWLAEKLEEIPDDIADAGKPKRRSRFSW